MIVKLLVSHYIIVQQALDKLIQLSFIISTFFHMQLSHLHQHFS